MPTVPARLAGVVLCAHHHLTPRVFASLMKKVLAEAIMRPGAHALTEPFHELLVAVID
jgi:hypothetical protein